MSVSRVATVALCPLATAGCLREEIVQPVRESIAVHAMAVVGKSSLGVALSRVPVAFGAMPITGATVRLVRGADTVQVVEAGTTSSFCFATSQGGIGYQGDAQCYAAILNAPIVAGETLSLEIELADGTVIRGATTTPAPVEIASPAANEDVEVTFFVQGFGFNEAEPVRVEWRDANRRADVRLEPQRFFGGGQARDADDCSVYGGFSTSSLPRSPGLVMVPFCAEMPWDSVDVELDVVAYDDSYLRYAAAVYEQGTGVVLHHAAVGIERVAGDAIITGVFGSAAAATIPLRLHANVVERGPRR